MLKQLIQYIYSAGVGRTGTYIALENLIQEAHDEKMGAPAVDVFTCVNKLRTQRMNMVQVAVSRTW